MIRLFGHVTYATQPRHGLIRDSVSASSFSATSVSYPACARSQYPLDRLKKRHNLTEKVYRAGATALHEE